MSFLWVLLLFACGGVGQKDSRPGLTDQEQTNNKQILPPEIAAARTSQYLPLLKNKKVGVVANHTSQIFKSEPNAETFSATHLVDSLLSLGIAIEKVFAPEHGFRGQADAGEAVADGRDKESGLPLISLYGSNKKPTAAQLKGLDIVLFDIQDVGVRFYTYIATLQLVMEACAEENIPILVLDRPNPNIYYIDGPMMEKEHRGFLGLTPIPLVYGMTIGEYAMMINGENWLEAGLKADLKVIPLANYTRSTRYSLPVRPSPNLPNARAVNLYPSLGLFEGTNINAGRGTEFQFQRFGAPFLDKEYFDFQYTPQANFGAKNPKHKGVICFGKDLSAETELDRIHLRWLIEAYQNCQDKKLFFNTSNFTKHAGTEKLQQQIEEDLTEDQIRSSWQKDIQKFKKIRAKYLIYD
ncbi:MAG: DUF1343 domain-containing protein [Flavobacteriaceae bacterium]